MSFFLTECLPSLTVSRLTRFLLDPFEGAASALKLLADVVIKTSKIFHPVPIDEDYLLKKKTAKMNVIPLFLLDSREYDSHVLNFASFEPHRSSGSLPEFSLLWVYVPFKSSSHYHH